jgi:hypothetical protein
VRHVEVSAHVPIPQTDPGVQAGQWDPEDQVSVTFRETELMRRSFDVEAGGTPNRDEHGGSSGVADGGLDERSSRQQEAAGEQGKTSPIQGRSHGDLLGAES